MGWGVGLFIMLSIAKCVCVCGGGGGGQSLCLGLSGHYLENHSTFCNQTWHSGTYQEPKSRETLGCYFQGQG